MTFYLGNWHRIISSHPLVFSWSCREHAGIVIELSGENLIRRNPGTRLGRGKGSGLGFCALLNIKGEKSQGHVCAVPNETNRSYLKLKVRLFV